MKDIDVNKIDVEAYLQWLFSKKGTTKEKELEKEKELYKSGLAELYNNTSLSEDEKALDRCNLEKRFTLMQKHIEKTSYWIPPTANQKDMILYFTNQLYNVYTRQLDEDLENRFIGADNIIIEHIERALKELNDEKYSEISKCLFNGWVVSDYINITSFLGLIKFVQYATHKKTDLENEVITINKPLKWAGKVSHLGYVMGLLAENGFIDAPLKHNGEINLNEFARVINEAFYYDGNKTAVLAKALNTETNCMGNNNKDLFKIPHIKEIS